MSPRMLSRLVAALLMAFAATACDDSEADPLATSLTASPPASVRPVAPALSTPAASSSAPRPSPTPPAAPVDGTVAPQNFGATEPVTIKANPDPPGATGILTDVRIGAHPEEGGWDRIVFQFRDVLPAGRIRYVPDAAGCGSGLPLALRGTALLEVSFTGAAAHDEAGRTTLRAIALPGPGGAILEAHQSCDFEGEVTWVVGTTGVQRYKVTLLDAPRRMVIDIKR